MKELSIEEKAKAYDEAIDKIKYVMEHGVSPTLNKEDLQDIFPELKESEGERIRKALISILKTDFEKDTTIYGISVGDIIAWLEKQGESFEEIEYNPFDDFRNSDVEVDSNEDGFIAETIRYKDECKQGKQKPSNNKPKFHEGEWIIIDGETMQIESVGDKAYNIKDEGIIPFRLENEMHLWTIQDAKDGDVLACKGNIKHSNGIKYERICLFNNVDKAFFTLTKTSNFVEEYSIDVNIDYPDNTVPATKEQKEILFMVMKEVGYEWNAEKKELNKIEQHPAWSEEDEAALGDTLWCCKQAASIAKDENDMGNIWYAENWLKSIKGRVQPKQEWSEEDENNLNSCISKLEIDMQHWEGHGKTMVDGDRKLISWLKSLKPQNRWKPSDEQIEILDMVLSNESMDDNVARILRDIREQLKKLRDELL